MVRTEVTGRRPFVLEVLKVSGTFRTMRTLMFAPALLMVVAPAFAVQEVTPAAPPDSRYERMIEDSPFALATPAAAPEAPKDSFTKDWVVTGLVPERDAQGVESYFVTIRSRDQTQQFSLFGNQANKDGVSIVSVERSPLTGKSKVTLKKGNEFGTVEFNQMEVQATPPGANIPGRPIVPGGAPQMVPGANPALRPPVNRAIPRPNFPTNNGVPVPPAVPQVNNGAAPLPSAPGAPGAADTRRRIRVINSKP
ncbi:hypothetical protein ACXR0O_20285 [Verrucomicrobiota bacterium sgz303538]